MKRWVALSGLAVFFASPVHAQMAPEVAKAQALFDSALALMGQKRYVEACPKLGEAASLLPEAQGIKEQQALCHEGQGLLATSWSEWTRLKIVADAAGQAERSKTAAEHLAALSPRLSTLAFHLAPTTAALPGLEVKRDGAIVGIAELATAVPVDPGTHSVAVSAPGYQPLQRTVEVPAERGSVVIELPALERVIIVPSPPLEPTGTPWQKKAAYGAFAVGGAAILAGGVLGGLAIATKDQSNAGPCRPDNLCTQEGVDLRRQARAFGNGSTWSIVGGAIVGAAGVTLLVLSPRAPTAQVRVTTAGVSLTGQFQ